MVRGGEKQETAKGKATSVRVNTSTEENVLSRRLFLLVFFTLWLQSLMVPTDNRHENLNKVSAVHTSLDFLAVVHVAFGDQNRRGRNI